MGKTIQEVEGQVKTHIAETRALLPSLPAGITFVWDKNLIIPGNGTGGSLLQPTVLGIGYDPDFEDQGKLAKNLRATVLHECFHAVQGWSDQNPVQNPASLLEDGVLEGAATVFERDVGGTSPPWASYEDDATMSHWLKEIKSQKLDPNSSQYNDYKFGSVEGVRWMLYKLGTWIIDKALARNPKLTIADLASKKPQKIIELARI